MRTIIAAVHGIGFAKPGDLEPALARLKLGDDQVTIDANWNDIAGKDYQNHVNFGQLRKLGRAIDATACLRPPQAATGPSPNEFWEIVVDLLDLFFTLPFWGIGPVLALLLVTVFQTARVVPGPAPVLAFIGFYFSAYFALAAAIALAFAAALILGARPLFVSRLFHLLLAAIRPWLFLSYGWLVLTRWGGEVEWAASISLAFLGVAAAWLTLAYFGSAQGTMLLVCLMLVTLYGAGPFLVAGMFAPGLKLMLDILLYVSDAAYRDSIQQSLAARIAEARGDADEARLVLIGHSLGSVIAADAIVRGGLGAQFGSIALVTAGSPIRRFFQKLFPGHLLPATAAALIEEAGRGTTFRWLNYYRRFDIVGARLGLPADGACVERRSTRIADPLSSHVNYWDESQFTDFIADIAGERARHAG